MVDPLTYFWFQPELHDWCNKGCGMCYPVLSHEVAAGFLSRCVLSELKIIHFLPSILQSYNIATLDLKQVHQLFNMRPQVLVSILLVSMLLVSMLL